jgi:hypothetical protein
MLNMAAERRKERIHIVDFYCCGQNLKVKEPIKNNAKSTNSRPKYTAFETETEFIQIAKLMFLKLW